MANREGCSPGYWGVEVHLGSWPPTGFSPADDFNTVFGRIAFDPPITLFQALNPETPVDLLDQLARQATAALLNAAHPDVNYPLNVADVITLFQAAFDSGNFESTKDLFEAYNNLFCPLNSNLL